MRKIAILLTVVVLLVAVVAVPTAGAFPEAGKGCHCHKMYGQAAVVPLHGAYINSDGANAMAKPIRGCACHL